MGSFCFFPGIMTCYATFVVVRAPLVWTQRNAQLQKRIIIIHHPNFFLYFFFIIVVRW